MSYTIVLKKGEEKEIIEKYSSFQIANTNQYMVFRAKISSTTITIFTSNKLLIQGKNDVLIYDEICKHLIIEINKSDKQVINDIYNEKSKQSSISSYSTIGSDEVGTGDFFGPIVVCAAYVSKDQVDSLYDLGINDSKLLSDDSIKLMAPKLLKTVVCSYLVLDNTNYNNLNQNKKMNMNKIKACMHNRVIYNLKKKLKSPYDSIIIDAFTPKNKYFDYISDQKVIVEEVNLIEKAEKLFASVAVASIIARYIFLREMNRLSIECGYILLKGANNQVDELASLIIKEKGECFLSKYAKMNFNNLLKAKQLIK